MLTKLEQFQKLLWKARRRNDRVEEDHLNELWDEATEKVKELFKGSPEPYTYEDVATYALRLAKAGEEGK